MSNPYSGVVLLDRDGVINKVDIGRYVNTPNEFELMPGAAKAISDLNDAGFYVGVCTNQSGVARGYLTEQTLHDIHIKMHGLLDREGAKVDFVTWCPHNYDDKHCHCRKPRTGQWLQHLRNGGSAVLEAKRKKFYMVGDMESDLVFGKSIGATPIFVTGGLGSVKDALLGRGSFIVALDLSFAVHHILREET